MKKRNTLKVIGEIGIVLLSTVVLILLLAFFKYHHCHLLFKADECSSFLDSALSFGSYILEGTIVLVGVVQLFVVLFYLAFK